MTELEKILIGAIGFAIVGIAGFAARILWVVIPRNLANNERQTAALAQMSQTMAWLPYLLSTQETKFEAALHRVGTDLQKSAALETEKTRQLFEAMFDKMQEAIERRLSGQEQALHDNQVELARQTGSNLKAVSVTASGNLMAISAQLADEALPAESTRATPIMSAEAGRQRSGTRPAMASSPGR